MNYHILANRAKGFLFTNYAKTRGYTYRMANIDELPNVYHFRWQVYSDEGYINPADYPNEEFTDIYDPASINFIVLHKNIIVGTVRLTRNSAAGIPTMNHFNVILPPEIKSIDDIVEIGRFMTKKEHRGSENRRIVSFCLSMAIYFYSLRRGIRWWIVYMPDKLKESFREFGVNFRILPEKSLTTAHLETRKIMGGYFEKKELKPMLADIYTISAW